MKEPQGVILRIKNQDRFKRSGPGFCRQKATTGSILYCVMLSASFFTGILLTT